eukprot:gb/GEZN01015978.1/.p1 GENE.gb/GEZN01015978.1/~~gb/GEZN01015978.1/.p1  ORF type:complete len:256 (+),score=30.90 gb/GEZN01015978.1/:21-788(+)
MDILGWFSRSWTCAQVKLNQLSGGSYPAPEGDALRQLDPEPKKTWEVLMIQAHPVGSSSFNAALAAAARRGLQQAGHTVTEITLYSDNDSTPFQPALTRSEWKSYFSFPYPSASPDTAASVAALQRCDALVLVYPTWWFGFPAVIKGWLDRTFLPGVAFRLPHLEPKDSPLSTQTGLIPGLTNIRKVGIVSTFGAPRPIVSVAGDNGRNLVSRALLPLFNPYCTLLHLGLYDMDHTNSQEREKFLKEVEESFKNF